MPGKKKKKICIDDVIREHIKKNKKPYRFFKLDKELKTEKEKVAYLLMKALIIREISVQSILLIGEDYEQVYKSTCHRAPVIYVKETAYCSDCETETQIKTEVVESVQGHIRRVTTIRDPYRKFTI